MKWIVLLSVCATALALPVQHQLHHHMTEDERTDLLGAAQVHETPEYDLTTPFESDRHGAPHNRRRRETLDSVYFKLSAFGEEFHLEVKHNTDLLTPGFFVQVTGQAGQSKLHFDNDPCHYLGELKSHSPSHVAVSDCDGFKLAGFIATKSTQLLLQPLPEHLVNSTANKAGHTHVIYKRSTALTNSTTRTAQNSTCAVEGSIPPSYYDALRELEMKTRLGEPVDENRTRYVIEGFVVTDSGLYQKHGRDAARLTNYVVTVMNIASSLYNYFNLGFNVRLVLTRIQMFTDKQTEEKQNLFITHNSSGNLESFSRWQSDSSRYIADDNNPLHYDHAFLLISKGMCSTSATKECGTLGRAWIKSVCSYKGRYAASVNSDKGLQFGFVIAHELGHNLGMYHDGQSGQCKAGDGYIMSPSTSGASKIHLWSPCSKAYLLDSIRENRLTCLRDCSGKIQPGFGAKTDYMLPGKVYNKDVQCQLSFPGSPGFCVGTEAEMCQFLWCRNPGGRRGCIGSYVPAADGTSCGQKKACYRGQCVKENSIGPPLLPSNTICSGPVCQRDDTLPTIDGNWGEWKDQTCSKSCGGGITQQRRECNNPSPFNCGEGCKGESTRMAICNTQPCPGVIDYRSVQCSALNARYQTNDMRPTYLHSRSKNQPCRLVCYSPSKRFQYNGLEVEDGTKCDQYSNDRCYNGGCLSVGCDNQVNSAVKIDYCGVCGGTNNTCSIVKGEYTQQQQRTSYYPVTVIPAGSKRIHVEEIQPARSIVLAASINGNRFLQGNIVYRDLIDIAGTTFEYNRPSSGPEILTAPGPTTEDIQLEAIIYSGSGPHFGLRYSYTTPAARSFFWKPKVFGKCSATCGGGVQTRRLVCRDTVTLVKATDSDCAHLAKPPTSQSCNTLACPFWWTSEWSSCPVTCGKGIQKRTVKCKRPVKTIKCPGPRPPRKRTCGLADCA